MSLFGIGKKDRDGRRVRIEHRGRHLRASRTGSVALREQIRAGGLSLTANTRQGERVSMTPARNTQMAFQNSRFVLRGRYGEGPAKLNVSKSGVSLSAKMGLGTINITNPSRSSAKIAGIQVRGQKAAAITAVAALIQMLAVIIKVTITAIVYLILGARNLGLWLYETTSALIAQYRFKRQQARRAARTRQLEDTVANWVRSNRGLDLTPETSLTAIKRLLAQAGGDRNSDQGEKSASQDHCDGGDALQQLVDKLSLVDDPGITRNPDTAELPVVGTAILATHYRESAVSSDLTKAFFQRDEMTLEWPPRTVGQELLLEDIADLFGLRLAVQAANESD